MTLKIPSSIGGIDGKAEYERIMNEKSEEKQSKLEYKVNPNQIILPNSDLQFVKDENLYKEIIKYLNKTFSNHKDKFSSKLSFDKKDNVMKGSNTYIATAVDMFLNKEMPDYRIARQIDLEQNLPMFKDKYVDTGLALKNLSNNTNKSQAEYLFNQLKQRGLSESDFPVWFNLRDLDLDNNLNFNLTDESLYKPKAECLNWVSGTHYSIIDNFGLPEKEYKSSNRQIWTNDNALSRCCLLRYSDLGSSSSDFSGSGDIGRVIFARNTSSVSSNKTSGGII